MELGDWSTGKGVPLVVGMFQYSTGPVLYLPVPVARVRVTGTAVLSLSLSLSLSLLLQVSAVSASGYLTLSFCSLCDHYTALLVQKLCQWQGNVSKI